MLTRRGPNAFGQHRADCHSAFSAFEFVEFVVQSSVPSAVAGALADRHCALPFVSFVYFVVKNLRVLAS
jgi:hypothetical protein